MGIERAHVKYVAMECGGSDATLCVSPNFIWNSSDLALEFITTQAIVPSGLRNAVVSKLCRLAAQSMRLAPGLI